LVAEGLEMAEIKKVYGIDLGTTYSAVATIDEFDNAKDTH
jgi:molecular chaperone DnaK (HSP70)